MISITVFFSHLHIIQYLPYCWWCMRQASWSSALLPRLGIPDPSDLTWPFWDSWTPSYLSWYIKLKLGLPLLTIVQTPISFYHSCSYVFQCSASVSPSSCSDSPSLTNELPSLQNSLSVINKMSLIYLFFPPFGIYPCWSYNDAAANQYTGVTTWEYLRYHQSPVISIFFWFGSLYLHFPPSVLALPRLCRPAWAPGIASLDVFFVILSS